MKSCGSCAFRIPKDKLYSTCTVLADKRWKLAGARGSPRPFWLALRLHKLPAHIPDMTTRTLSTEGKECAAYISNEVALAAP
jgi:hypothetical protein